MASIFEQTIVPKIPFSNFNLSETQLISQNFGELVPCYVREVLPNDVFQLSAFLDTEFAPMVAPMRQDVNASIHFFFCPDRILFDGFETFITGSEDGHALTTEAELARMPEQPGIKANNFKRLFTTGSGGGASAQGSIFDYLGLPNTISLTDVSTAGDQTISDLPLRAYFKIWYDYYRDENLQYDFLGSNGQRVTYYNFWRQWRMNSHPDQWIDNLKGAFNPDFHPFYRSFKKDYFTGALQSPQKGEPVSLNIGDSAPVTINTQSVRLAGNDSAGTANPGRLALQWTGDVSDAISNGTPLSMSQGPYITSLDQSGIDNQYDSKSVIGVLGKLEQWNQEESEYQSVLRGVADLTKARAITVEALREAFAVQEILESLSLRGSRFVEFLRGNFGVIPDDYRLQRPQFLGGIVTPVAVQRVLQTSGYSGEDARDMTGYAAGRAFAAAGKRCFRQRFKEHGYIIGILSYMPKAFYYQGIPRHFVRKDRFDYYLPQTAHLGEQPIENQELFYSPIRQGNVDPDNHKVFGYIPRWAEYKIAYNGIHGDFRGSLNYYHMARVFASTPTLSEEFISTKNVQTRPFAVWKSENPNINHLIWSSLYFDVVASRPIPYHSIPKIQ